MKKRKLFALFAMLVMACLAFAGCNNSSSDDEAAGGNADGGTGGTTPVVEMVTVTYDANGHGTAPAAAAVAVGSKLTKPADPSETGYTFGGWYKEAGCTNAWDFDNDAVAAATTLYAKWSMLYVPGTFSVADGKTVHFAPGNLVATYSSSTSSYTWGFAEHQYEYVGNNAGNTSIASQQDGAKVDLFGWVGASSTTLTGDSTKYGISNSTSYSDYGDSTSDTLMDDWGKNIVDGNTWRTLTKDEWTYLLETRSVNGGEKEGYSYRRATVCSVYGMIIYPDGYTAKATSASYTAAEWTAMENAGCVFLPITGYRSGSNVNDKSAGYYWSSTPYSSDAEYACYLKFESSTVDVLKNGFLRYCGQSVRLVCDAD